MTETGIWGPDEARQSGYPKSPNLCAKLAEVLRRNRLVLDFGCGDAFYITKLQRDNFTCIGVDGHLSNRDPELMLYEVDLSKRIKWPISGQVLSLEVGEHIPEQYEQNFIDNLCNHCDSRMVLSWAVEGQAGVGHVNCRNNDYIKAEIVSRGFEYKTEVSAYLRQGIEKKVSYFSNTLMVFDRV